jgi:hypothetical protein
MWLLQPMTANIPQPADAEAAKAASDMAMKMLCPMHQTMVTAPAMVMSHICGDANTLYMSHRTMHSSKHLLGESSVLQKAIIKEVFADAGRHHLLLAQPRGQGCERHDIAC